jgi:hypothetical protein
MSGANPPPLKTRKLGRTGVNVIELKRENLIGADAPALE